MIHGENEEQPELPPFRFQSKYLSPDVLCGSIDEIFQILCWLVSALTQNIFACFGKQLTHVSVLMTQFRASQADLN